MLKLTTDRHEASHGLSAIAELDVVACYNFVVIVMVSCWGNTYVLVGGGRDTRITAILFIQSIDGISIAPPYKTWTAVLDNVNI